MRQVIWLLPMAIIACSGAQTKKDAESVKAEALKVTTEAPAVEKAASTGVQAEEKKTSGSVGKITCRHGKEERVLETLTKGEGCETHYTKAGETKTIATAVKGTVHCSGMADKIKSKLESAGFQCQ